RTGVPYVLDFRDSWTLTVSEFEARRPGWATLWDRRTLDRLLRGTQAVIFRYHTEAECYWRAYQGIPDVSKIHIIPNGYEGEIEKFRAPRGNYCTVLYSGTLSDYRYDTLLLSVKELKRSCSDLVRWLRILFVGEGMEALVRDAAAMGLSDIVETRPPVSN